MNEKIDNKTIMENINKKLSEILPNDTLLDINIPTYIPIMHKKKILVLSGGGIKGISFLGALNVLDKLGILKNIEIYAGTSVGSIILFLINIGYSPMELFELVKKINLNKLKTINLSLFLNSMGLDNGEKIISLLKRLMKHKNINEKITFKELHDLTKKTFIVNSVNIDKQCSEYFSYMTHPDISVIYIIRMSFSIPFLFTPIEFNGFTYVDGGCIDNFSINYFSDRKDELLGICIESVQQKRNKNCSFDEYAINVIGCILNGATSTISQQYENYIIKILINDVTTIDFDISLDKKNYLYEIGCKSVYDNIHLIK